MNCASRILAACAALLFASHALALDVYYDGASHAQTLVWTAPDEYTYMAQPIKTGPGASATVTQMTLQLAAVSQSPASQPALYVFSESGGHPGSLLATFNATGAAVHGLNTFTGSVTLAPSTVYFVVFYTSAGQAVVSYTSTADGPWHDQADFPNGAQFSTYTGSPSQLNQAAWVDAKTLPNGSYDIMRLSISGTTGQAGPDSTLSNLSVRIGAGSGSQTVIIGFVTANGSKNLLVRALGPTLTSLGVPGALADPQLAVYDGTTIVASNDNWGGTTTLKNAFTTLGAYPLPDASKDSAALTLLPAKPYTVQLTGGSGIVLGEIYDADAAVTTPPSPAGRLSNLSARAQVGTGNNILIAGFVINGSSPKRLLLRGVGPKLATYGVTGTLANPQLQVYSGSTLVTENNDWDGSTTLTDAFTTTGAFPLDAGSKDAAIIVTLDPGVYTVQVSGVNNSTGVGLVEIYEMP
ncbi:hypothetical protein K0B96_11230 [Horticoccus luteus]|uniref:DUF642 domain-containing protein n=1 Tax=Horticoccus luteus TaxID=2862869 RepID=A0A8F9XIR9_9BACT|nr:choice-of-anchor R domain-containing protein [Horticoccus luteus]QYM77888.1 hypothetical protein K0B96_11230 [Horticoccus luteus]